MVPDVLYHATLKENLASIKESGLLPHEVPLMDFTAVWMARDIGYAIDHRPYKDRVILEVRTAGLDPNLLEPWTGVHITDPNIVTQQYIYLGTVRPENLRVNGWVEWGTFHCDPGDDDNEARDGSQPRLFRWLLSRLK